MDYHTLFTRPFEFVAERLGPVEMPVVYCDADVEEHQGELDPSKRYTFGRVILVSNKELMDYREQNGLYIKELSSDEIITHFSALVRAIGTRGFYIDTTKPSLTEQDLFDADLFQCFQRDLLKPWDRYIFVASSKASKIIGRTSYHIPEEAIMVHELAHSVENRVNYEKLKSMGLSHEAVPKLLDFLYTTIYYPQYLDDYLRNARISHFLSEGEQRAVYELVLSYVQTPEKIPHLLQELNV